MSETSPFTPRARDFLERTAASMADQTPEDLVRRVEALVADHDAWRGRCLNMNPAESGLSRRAQDVLASDMAARLSEGLPGDKAYPHGGQNRHVDELEGIIIAQARRQFGAAFVEWRPVSTSMANAAVFFGLLEAGDTILAQDEDGGGNFSYHASGPAGLISRRIVPAPSRGEAFELDLDRMAALAAEVRPRMIVVGGSNVLFPYPVRELRAIADRCGAILLYDAAHLGLLISAGDFQRPLEEGAHVVTVSTHKIMGGPVGGLVLTNDAAIASKVLQVTFPGFLQTRDQNKYAALAVALAENAAFGRDLSSRMVANAQALEGEGFRILARDRGYTATHQIFLQLGDEAQRFEAACQGVNILAADCALTGDMSEGRRSGARLATHELTRLGMGEADMTRIARLMRRAFDGENPAGLAREVADLVGRFTPIRYSFDAGRGAAPADRP
ncbi:hypothetical protein [Phenylobacterium sp.]|uniref:hypothetical protein n=1 Tax=Phenylobacterium sp. TaxID=1871053 RepID=UPI0035678748